MNTDFNIEKEVKRNLPIASEIAIRIILVRLSSMFVQKLIVDSDFDLTYFAVFTAAKLGSALFLKFEK